MFKINLLFAFSLCCTIVGIKCAPTANTTSAVQGGFAFEMIMTKLQLLEDRSIASDERKVQRSCSGVSSSGIYTIQPEKPFKEPISVLCDQEYDRGGWIVIQHRFDGSTNFYRNWKEYKNGFGNLDVSGPHELIVLLEDFDGNKTYAKYDQFEIGDESEKYILKMLGEYSGTAGNSLVFHKNMTFSTFDEDNDTHDINCAITYTGAWWYHKCHHNNLNGKYLRGATEEYATGMVWVTFRGNYYSLKMSKMMIRPKKPLVH